MENLIYQYEIYLINLDPTIGVEIQKTRPCIVISPDEINEHLQTVIIAPITSKSKPYPTRVNFEYNNKINAIVLDQIKTIDKSRIQKHIGKIDESVIKNIKDILKEMLID